MSSRWDKVWVDSRKEMKKRRIYRQWKRNESMNDAASWTTRKRKQQQKLLLSQTQQWSVEIWNNGIRLARSNTAKPFSKQRGIYRQPKNSARDQDRTIDGGGRTRTGGGQISSRWNQGLRFRFWKKFRWPPETVYRPKFRGFPVISIGKSFQIQNSEISVYRPVFRCISPVFRCFSPKNDGNSWKMMGKLCICEKKLKILGSLP